MEEASAHAENVDGPVRPWYRRLSPVAKVTAVLLLAIALFYGVENWRGRVRWERCQAELKAKGKETDLRKLLPPEIPDEENFAAIPLVQEWFRRGGSSGLGSNYAAASELLSERLAAKNERHLRDLALWEKAFGLVASNIRPAETLRGGVASPAERVAAAPAVLAGLADSAPGLEQLRLASTRPGVRYPIDYKLQDPAGILILHLSKIKQAIQHLQLRANAKLALGQGEEALADILLMAHLADSVRSEMFVISYLVRVAGSHLVFQPVWEGLAERRWTEPQLRVLQDRLARMDFLDSFHIQADGELACGLAMVDSFSNNTYSWGAVVAGDDFAEVMAAPIGKKWAYNMIWAVTPSGWFGMEKANYGHYYGVMQAGTVDAAARRFFPRQVDDNAVALERDVFRKNPAVVMGKHTLLTCMLLPALQKISTRAASAQVSMDQAVLGCALERYRLAHAEFPERLDALVPAFLERLPKDVLTGDNYHYRRTPSGSFLLYSLGWDGKDDGGIPGNQLHDSISGDWVWSYPELK